MATVKALTAMEKKSDGDYRFERKFAVTSLTKAQLDNLIQLHPAAFSQEYPQRNVNNIYFDTYEYKAAQDNLDGIASRCKVRIRWYGDLFGAIRAAKLEFKYKEGMVGRKERYTLDTFSLDAGFDPRILQESLSDLKVPERVRYHLRQLSPMLLNRYTRQYYRSADRLFRLTVDHGLGYYRLQNSHNYFINKQKAVASLVVELKYPIEVDELAGTITNGFPFRLTKNSKYVSGAIQIME